MAPELTPKKFLSNLIKVHGRFHQGFFNKGVRQRTNLNLPHLLATLFLWTGAEFRGGQITYLLPQ